MREGLWLLSERTGTLWLKKLGGRSRSGTTKVVGMPRLEP